MPRALLAVGLLMMGWSSPPTVEVVLSPASVDCPVGIVRANTLPPEDLIDAMHGHVPTDLPEGFGLLGSWGAGEGPAASGIWADHDCREVRVGVVDDNPTEATGPSVGPWTVTADLADGCGNAVLGEGRCLSYVANADDGIVIVSMMGIDRPEGDQIVRSIPL